MKEQPRKLTTVKHKCYDLAIYLCNTSLSTLYKASYGKKSPTDQDNIDNFDFTQFLWISDLLTEYIIHIVLYTDLFHIS